VFGIGFFPDQVAVDTTTNRIYVANAFDDDVSVINGSTDTVIDTILVGDQPVGIAANAAKNRIYVTNDLDGTVSVIDGSTNTVVAEVNVGTNPFGIDVNPLTDRIYVANRSDDTVSVVLGPSIRQIEIDIKPGSDRNPINLKSKGNIPVAILSSDTFDATQVNWETVRFGPSEATEKHQRVHVKDADYDGDMDVVLHFKTRDTGILCGDTEATLTGETFSG
jgi:YVTN family beta-propeller protein